MTFLPIVEREMRVASRRRTTFWGRMLLSSLAIVIGVCTFCANLGEDQTEAGPVIFRWLAGAMLLYALFFGARSTADSLSSEKRDGTLGLLFLTDLKGYDIVLGKMAATGINGFYALLAVFPMMAVPLLMGGISQGEFWRMVLVLVDTFIFSLAIGIFASAVCREARSAMSANFLFVIIPSVMLPGLAAVLMDGSPRNLIRELLLASPGYPFVMSFDRFYATESFYYWMSLATLHGLTWICVILASNIVPHSWQDRPVVRSARPGLRELWRQRRYGDPIQRAALRTRLLAHNAFLWLACRDRRKQFRVWMFLGFMTAWWTWGRVQSGYVWFEAGIALFAAFLVNAALKMWVAFETSERLAEDRGNGALELLLSTKMTVPDILEGQRLALQRIFIKPVLIVFVAEVYLLWLSLNRAFGSDFTNALFTWIAIFIMFAADAMALYWVGLYTAMTSRRPGQAAMAAVLRVLALPWVMLGLVHVVISVALYFEAIPSPGFLFYLGVWVGFGLLTDGFFALRARRELLTRFRELPAMAAVRRRPRGQ